MSISQQLSLFASNEAENDLSAMLVGAHQLDEGTGTS